MVGSKNHDFPIVMFPWLAIGHMTPFFHLANKLAEKGHKITLILPQKAVTQLQNLNLHPEFITTHTLTVPPVDGLPPGTETAADIHISLTGLLAIAMDRSRDQVEGVIRDIKPKMVVYDLAYWVPEITRPLGIKTICYHVVCAASVAILLVPARNITKDKPLTVDELAVPPPGYPSSTVVLRHHEAKALCFVSLPFGEKTCFYERATMAMKNSDLISIRTCLEIEGPFCTYIASQYGIPVIPTGPLLPEPTKALLDDRWTEWLGGFEPGSVVFCAFGSQYVPEKDQFQELVLGFEQTGLPFLIAVKPPTGASSVEEALPEGFKERVKGRGVVWGGWVQQPKILAHPAIGCFVSHCGFGSMWESLMNNSQIVLVPQLGDQILNTRLLVEEMKVAVEVEREENGWFSKESLSKGILSVMGKDSEKGEVLRENHKKWRDLLSRTDFMDGYIHKFIKSMHELCEVKDQ